MNGPGQFLNLNTHGFLRVGVAVPRSHVADPAANARETIALMRKAAEQQVSLVLFPELGLSSYTCDDLFHQRALLDASLRALASVCEASRELELTTVVGLPLQLDDLLFNCAAVVHRGRVLGLVPKTYLPNYREFYEARQFASGTASTRTHVALGGQGEVPFGSSLLFQLEEQPQCTFHVEICEDLWVPIPPSSHAALAGATVLLNLSASNVTIAKADYRRHLAATHSARCLAAYLYSAAGTGESTTDLAWDGQALIYDCGLLLAEGKRFSREPQLVVSEIDLERLSQERMRQTTFGQSVQLEQERARAFRTVTVPQKLERARPLPLERAVERFPYVPSDSAARDERCEEVYQIQVEGLAQRLRSTGLKRVIIGISGGLDSTQALLVCAQAMDQLGLPRENILAVTMPGFATSSRTLDHAWRLMKAVGTDAREIDIRPSCMQMLKDIGHPYARGEPVCDVTFENVQAGERTSHLFRLANLHNGLVVGTGDLSELALGWCTYGVGDHMSHYSVNASVPKTLIQHVIRWVAESGRMGPDASQTLLEVLETPISPELVPGSAGAAGPSQETEAVLGPYELHDFFLYYTLRFGFSPERVAFLAYSAWHDRSRGNWPGLQPRRNQYTLREIKKHLRTFLVRFFQLSQFKRSCVPNAPKVGSGGSLSPRGDWRAPSDGSAAPWLEALDTVPDEA